MVLLGIFLARGWGGRDGRGVRVAIVVLSYLFTYKIHTILRGFLVCVYGVMNHADWRCRHTCIS